MTSPTDPHSPRSVQRRWRVPPAPRSPSGTFEGLGILEEIPEELGVVLWQALRDVALWTSCPPGERSRLFVPGAERSRLGPALAAVGYRELESPLETLASLVRAAGAARAEVVALACMQIAQWADARGALATALSFAESAARAVPGDAGMAFAAGRLARRGGEQSRAETWYLRAVGMGRQSGDWASYAQAFLGLGHIQVQRGDLPMAERRYGRALRAARRRGLRGVEAQALHNLFVLAAEGLDPAGAEQYAREALHVYGSGHAELPPLAHNLAHFWLLQGLYSRALPVFEALLPHSRRPAERLLVLADIARAAGGAGLRERFRQASAEVWRLVQDPTATEGAAPSVLDLAHGALALGEWTLAEEAAQYVIRVATHRDEARVRAAAEALLESVAAGRAAGVPDRVPEPSWGEDSLVEDFVRSLSACSVSDPDTLP